MTKAKNITYKNGMKFRCGPPIRAGAYMNWNWCKICDAIYKKPIIRCKECNQQLRSKAKCNNNWPE